MANLFHLRKSLLDVLNIKHVTFLKRRLSMTAPLLCFKQRLTRLDTFKEREQHFLARDKVPENYQLIYKAPMESYIAWAMHVSTLTASAIGAMAVYQFAVNKPLLDPIGTTLTMQSEDIYYFAAGFLALNIILRLVASMYALRIYKDQLKYLVVYHPQLPFGISHNNFQRGEVKGVHYKFSPWNRVTYKLGGKTSLLLEHYFKTPSDFHEMQSRRTENS